MKYLKHFEQINQDIDFKIFEKKKKKNIDDILDKMSDVGYEGLTSKEKAELAGEKPEEKNISGEIKKLILRLKELETELAKVSKKLEDNVANREEFIRILGEEYGVISSEYYGIEDTLIDDMGLTEEEIEKYKNIF
jgi:hypothetical protein